MYLCIVHLLLKNCPPRELLNLPNVGTPCPPYLKVLYV